MKTKPCPKCKGAGTIPDPISQGKEMRALREKSGLSLRSMANAMKISAAYLSDMELGNRAWTDKHVAKFNKLLNENTH